MLTVRGVLHSAAVKVRVSGVNISVSLLLKLIVTGTTGGLFSIIVTFFASPPSDRSRKLGDRVTSDVSATYGSFP